MELVKVVVWYSIEGGGDGSAYNNWFLTQNEASQNQEDQEEGWGEECIGSVETYEGSDVFLKATEARLTSELQDILDEYKKNMFISIREKNVDIYGATKAFKEDLMEELVEFSSELNFKFV